ncbi:hypothetical protein J7E81_01520 [Bacillus sp. ISL-18]|uniref:hypothetical protein n=1 Tax=Bacillus sp. ISL-18 TaxID=2819118 RepID=UPI001BEB50CE|nr:hypothetical protein [Bacillus sp. ISL-18]MBT2653925.1 hypothetical protein [Bacillus sp. ISL-18]
MLSSFGMILIAILISIYELRPMMREKLFKEAIIFCFLLSSGTLLTILITLGVNIPNPLNWVITFIKPLTDLIDILFT